MLSSGLPMLVNLWIVEFQYTVPIMERRLAQTLILIPILNEWHLSLFLSNMEIRVAFRWFDALIQMASLILEIVLEFARLLSLIYPLIQKFPK